MCQSSWSLLKGFRSVDFSSGLATFKAANQFFRNKSYSATGDFSIAVNKAKNGGDYNLVITKNTVDDVQVSLPDNSRISGSTDTAITLSGDEFTKYWLHFTFDGTDYIWTLAGVSSGAGGVDGAALLATAEAYADAADLAVLDAAQLTAPEVVAASYTFVLADKDKLKIMNSEAAQQFIVPSNASVAFPIGARIHTSTEGVAGITTFSAEGGVTINSADGFLKLRTRFSCATIVKTAANEWLLTGDLSL